MIQIILHHQVEEHQVQELLKVLSDQIPISEVQYSLNGSPKADVNNSNLATITDTCFYVKKKDRYVKIAIDDILWVKGDGSCVKIITEMGEIMGMLNLNSFLKQVPYPSLLRIHRSYVVNKCKITAFDNGVVYINNKGEEKIIPIGATYREEFKRQMLRLLSD